MLGVPPLSNSYLAILAPACLKPPGEISFKKGMKVNGGPFGSPFTPVGSVTSTPGSTKTDPSAFFCGPTKKLVNLPSTVPVDGSNAKPFQTGP